MSCAAVVLIVTILKLPLNSYVVVVCVVCERFKKLRVCEEGGVSGERGGGGGTMTLRSDLWGRGEAI